MHSSISKISIFPRITNQHYPIMIVALLKKQTNKETNINLPYCSHRETTERPTTDPKWTDRSDDMILSILWDCRSFYQSLTNFTARAASPSAPSRSPARPEPLVALQTTVSADPDSCSHAMVLGLATRPG